ncbi:hypothetical protein [Nostoc punctiforme]|uniref:hypothetical protein n=1 Tax=Nostoc punctiforme TaxID=272131 RepID=UPI0002FA3266|nr:hypothetical protein [Nostoc punctiforme]
MPKKQGFCWIKKTELLILLKEEARIQDSELMSSGFQPIYSSATRTEFLLNSGSRILF